EESRHSKQRGRDDMQEPGTGQADSRMAVVLGSETTLHQVLAGSVVPDANAEKAGEHTGEWEQLMARGMEDLKPAWHFVDKLEEPADLRQAENGNEDAASEKHGHLHEVGPGRRAEAAVYGVRAGEQTQHHDPP